LNEEGWPHAGGELVVGNARMCFLVDFVILGRMADYHHQWRQGIATTVYKARRPPQSMTVYRGPGDSAHTMWALWREQGYVYVQEHSVLPADLDSPFDPNDPYPHVGERIPAPSRAFQSRNGGSKSNTCTPRCWGYSHRSTSADRLID
jgi:hypothetical protein